MHRKENTLKLSKELAYISFGWLLLGMALGNILNAIVPKGILEGLEIYTSYTSRIEEKALFLLTTFVNLAISPISIMLMRKYGFHSKIPRLKAKIFLISLVFIFLPIALDVIPIASIGGTTKHDKTVLALTSHWDWLGASLYIYLYLWLTAFSISAATTTGRAYG